MSEEIKKEAQDVELSLEDLDKVAGGFGDYKCPKDPIKNRCLICGA